MAKYGMHGKPHKAGKPKMGKIPKEKSTGMVKPHEGLHTGHNEGFHDSEMSHDVPKQSEGCGGMGETEPDEDD